ncbi:Putative Polyketide synthase PksN [Kitasatospora sp. MMS16-BH015]|uniref:acyl carrier protein n=1 Tax=Kitasatospora sp. MMS16-BH015 TaxID=2018025 RepID=UPI000CA24C43|nr:acyl carrier protein [Kitasatospora sp. MMS16-BH015]AUG78891.1 Putative Polyketide synthase PksN [Kitasatospora sp. MMS16-BH015]
MRGTDGRPPLAIISTDGTEHELCGWLTARLHAQLPGTRPIDPDTQLIEYGMDSVVALGLYGEIEEVFGLKLDFGAVYEYATVHELAAHLAARAAVRRPRPGAGS